MRNPGNYEVALGTTVREIIELAGGLRPGRKLMAVQPGGGSSACIFEEQLDWPYDYESMAKAGSMLGSGAFVVFDDTTDFVNAAYNLVRFFAHESCGQCTPCREGGSWMERVLERLVHRRGVAGDDEMLLRVSSSITGLNLCPLGDSIEPFLKSVMQRFPEQFKARIAVRGGSGMSAPLLAPSTQMVNLTIDGVPVTVPKGTLLVEAAKTIQQQIPIYCYHTKLGPAGLCRICVVEIEGTPKLQIACNTVAADGMAVRTCGEEVDAARAMVLELFLVNHPLDCPICDKGGECDLQDYAMAYARGTSDVADPKLSKPKAVDLGPTIVLDEERCIVCQRCVRFDDIIADERQLVVKDRGARDIIATATGLPYRHNFTGNVTELCPVGALTSKTYRFKSRPWDLNRTQTTCTQCAVGCQQFADVRQGKLLRTHAGRRRSDLGRLALRPRPLQRRILRRARSVDAAALPQGWELRADRLGRRLHPVGEGDPRSDCNARRRQRRRDRRRQADE